MVAIAVVVAVAVAVVAVAVAVTVCIVLMVQPSLVFPLADLIVATVELAVVHKQSTTIY
jgi:hypothetical protein